MDHETAKTTHKPDLAVTYADLTDLRRLSPNWDGYGAPPIDPQTIDVAAEFIMRFESDIRWPPAVVPMTGGRLEFEWTLGSRALEIEFENPHTIHFLKCDDALEIEDEGVVQTHETKDLSNLLQWFFSGAVNE